MNNPILSCMCDMMRDVNVDPRLDVSDWRSSVSKYTNSDCHYEYEIWARCVFCRLFEGSSRTKQEKLKTLLWYFGRVTQKSEFGFFARHTHTLVSSRVSRLMPSVVCFVDPRAERSHNIHQTASAASALLVEVSSIFTHSTALLSSPANKLSSFGL